MGRPLTDKIAFIIGGARGIGKEQRLPEPKRESI